MQPQTTGILYPIQFDDPADLHYLGVTHTEIRRNIQRLANQGFLEKVLEGNARPTERLLSRYESDDRSGLGLAAVDSPARAAHGETEDRKFERLAIEEARKSVPEDERVHPKVGVVVVKNGGVLATAYRGEIPESHAEYIALERKLPEEPLPGATVYTTLEPCTSRNHPKLPCANRLAERKVARVVIGMVDPDDRISGRGLRALRKAGIDTGLFPADLMAEIEELNRDFIREREARPGGAPGLYSAVENPAASRLISNLGIIGTRLESTPVSVGEVVIDHRTFVQLVPKCLTEAPVYECMGHLRQVRRWSSSNQWETTDLGPLILGWGHSAQKEIALHPGAENVLNVAYIQHSNRQVVPWVHGDIPPQRVADVFRIKRGEVEAYQFDIQITCSARVDGKLVSVKPIAVCLRAQVTDDPSNPELEIIGTEAK